MTVTTTTYTLRGGEIITATSPSDFVRQLHDGSRFDQGGTDHDYMIRFACRLHQFDGSIVRATDPDLFLADLIRCGYATVLSCS